MRGLMTIAPWGVAEDVTRACFRSLRGLAGSVGRGASEIEFRCAVDGDERGLCAGDSEGATRIRVGTALFGARKPQTERE